MSGTEAPLLANATRDLAAFAAKLNFNDIPAEAIERIKYCALDSIGCCLFGVIFGGGGKTTVAHAVLVNGTAGHAFELDDMHKESIVHPGSLATPVALAFAEAAGGAPGRDVITGMVAGYEVGTRVGNAATMSLFLRGFHPQGTSGAFVAAGTAGRMLNLDAGQMQHTLGIVGSQAGGLMAAQEGAMVKRFHCGRAAQSGVYSALLAKRGFTGVTDVLEAPYGGYLSSYSDKPNPQRLTAGIGKTWETLNVGYKPHASVTSIHTTLDALADLMRENKLKPDDIAAVDAGVSHMTYVHCAWEYKAQGVTAAQMNLFYGLAVIAYDGVAFVDQYREDRLRDPKIFDFIKRITARVDPEIEGMGAAFRHAARLSLTTRDGRTFTREILNRRGSPENPLKPEDIEYKFRHVVKSCLTPANIDKVMQLVAKLDKLDSTSELISILAAPTAR
jgi:2-methylcitrate dehydratase PrpD